MVWYNCVVLGEGFLLGLQRIFLHVNYAVILFIVYVPNVCNLHPHFVQVPLSLLDAHIVSGHL